MRRGCGEREGGGVRADGEGARIVTCHVMMLRICDLFNKLLLTELA